MSSMSKIDSKVSISVTLPLAPRETDLYPVIEVVSLPQYTNWIQSTQWLYHQMQDQ